MRPTSAATVALGLALLAACARTGTGPEAFRIAEDATDHVVVRWYPPASGDFDGYVLEWRTATGAFVPVATFPASSTGGEAALGAEVPDAVDVEFRLRATPDPDATRSATAVLARGPRAPAIRCKRARCAAERDGLPLYLTNRSPGATAIVVRSARIAPGSTTREARAPVELSPDSTHWVDAFEDGWAEEHAYVWEVSAVKNGRESAVPERVVLDRLPLATPANVSAAAAPGGWEVSFEGRSARARCYAIDRVAPQGSARVATCLPPPAVGATASFLDSGASAASPPLYRVTAVGQLASSFPVDAWTAPPPGPGLAARLVTLPSGPLAVRLSSGAFASASIGSWIVGSVTSAEVHAPGPFGPEPLPPGVPPYPLQVALALDGEDRVHALISGATTQYYGASPTFHHAIFSDGRWSVEPMPTLVASGILLETGIDGVLRAAWGAADDLFVARRTAAGWSREAVPALLPALAMDADASGVAHVVCPSNTSTDVVHWRQSPSGWLAEPLTIGNSVYELTFLAGPGPMKLLAAGTYVSRLFERTDAGWGAAQELTGRWIAARSADGASLVLAGPTEVRVSGPGGVRLLQRPASGALRSAAGVDAAGKAWILEFLGADAEHHEVTAVLYEEP